MVDGVLALVNLVVPHLGFPPVVVMNIEFHDIYLGVSLVEALRQHLVRFHLV